jgi:hypothetical protein
MRILCFGLLSLVAVSTLSCVGQQTALVSAPDTATDTRTDGAGPESAAILPGPVRHAGLKPEKLSAYDWSLLGAAAGLRFLDYKTTVKFTEDPANFREVELPETLVHNRPALGAFEASTVVANYFVYRTLADHGHRRMARFGQYLYVGAMAGTVGWNYDQLNKYWPHARLLRRISSGQ